MFNVSREEVRAFWFELWRKHREGQPLAPIEALALDIVLLHPEYHSVLADPETYRDEDWTVEGGQTSPFLHMGMHLAIREQVSIDQPMGIRELYVNYAHVKDDAHEADHVFAECLAEQIWQLQRNQRPFDSAQYLHDLRRAVKM